LTGQGALARPEPVGPGPVSLDIAARPIPALLARAPGQTRFGALAFRGGLVLSAREAAFGGFSGLWRSDDGQRIVAVSDNAHWLTARLQREGGQLAGLTDAVLAPMLGAGGRPLSRTRSYDTEGLAMAGGVAYVGVERSHEVLRFDWAARGVAARGQPMALPAEARVLVDITEEYRQVMACVERSLPDIKFDFLGEDKPVKDYSAMLYLNPEKTLSFGVKRMLLAGRNVISNVEAPFCGFVDDTTDSGRYIEDLVTTIRKRVARPAGPAVDYWSNACTKDALLEVLK
jgi:hypothetical protein